MLLRGLRVEIDNVGRFARRLTTVSVRFENADVPRTARKLPGQVRDGRLNVPVARLRLVRFGDRRR